MSIVNSAIFGGLSSQRHPSRSHQVSQIVYISQVINAGALSLGWVTAEYVLTGASGIVFKGRAPSGIYDRCTLPPQQPLLIRNMKQSDFAMSIRSRDCHGGRTTPW